MAKLSIIYWCVFVAIWVCDPLGYMLTGSTMLKHHDVQKDDDFLQLHTLKSKYFKRRMTSALRSPRTHPPVMANIWRIQD